MTSNPLEIINRQILKWERSRQDADRQGGLRQPRPVITISSAYGSSGWQIGRLAADLLGFDFYDRQLVERIAESANVREKVAESLDDRVQDWITEHLSHQFDKNIFTHSDFLRHLSRVVLTIGQHGQAVIIGRGSQFILDPQQVLRVRTIAPFEERIRMVVETEQLSPIEARAATLHKDAERAAFCRLHFNRDVTDPNYYDLLINTSSMSVEQHADLIVYSFLMRFGQQARAAQT